MLSRYIQKVGGNGGGYICDTRTTDAGKVCYDGKQCQGACLAPPQAAIGKHAEGTCSAYIMVPYDTWQVGDGFEFNLNVFP